MSNQFGTWPFVTKNILRIHGACFSRPRNEYLSSSFETNRDFEESNRPTKQSQEKNNFIRWSSAGISLFSTKSATVDLN